MDLKEPSVLKQMKTPGPCLVRENLRLRWLLVVLLLRRLGVIKENRSGE